MKIVSLKLNGYRRFATEQTLQLDAKLVALLGPNEAGKSSILKALQYLNGSDALSTQGPSIDVTRGLKHAKNLAILTATFLIEPSDLIDLHLTSPVRWLILRKYKDGKRVFELNPRPTRNVSRRKEILSHLQTFRKGSVQYSSPVDAAVTKAIDDVLANVSDLDADTLSEQSLTKLDALVSLLTSTPSEEVPAGLSEIKAVAMELTEAERQEHPNDATIKHLERQLPLFVPFTEEQRDLRSSYNLREFYGDKKNPNFPAALRNIAQTAGLDLESLFNAERTNDVGGAQTMLDRANEVMRKVMASWTQSRVEVKFSINSGSLAILVRSDAGQLEAISERSDGLRQFVALVLLVSKRASGASKPILLIDEAELHLHYDAQADLIQMFAKQDVAPQVIYSTHSIGCLPEDLGAGVRLISPNDHGGSEIINKFWTKDRRGLSPIFYGMGATTMAFLPLRYCVLTEGQSDVILLPSLLRQANDITALGFLVSPGLAEASEQQVSIMQNEGSRVLFAIDGDQGGMDIRAKMARAGIAPNKIIDVGCPRAAVIEDYLKPTVYADAINEQIARRGGEARLLAEGLPDLGRPAYVRNWCTGNGVAEPSKVDVAYRILEIAIEEDIVDPLKRDDLISLYHRIHANFAAVAARDPG